MVKQFSSMKLALAAFTVTLGAPSAAAQDVPIIRTHVTEVGGFVGASYGVDHSRVMGGGNVVYSLTRVIMPFAEVSYFPGIERTVPSVTPGFSTKYDIPVTDFNFGLHIRVPIPRSRVVPYGVIACGGLYQPGGIGQGFGPNGPVDTVTREIAGTVYATSFGGGLRYYMNERLGFRVEFKGYATASGANTFLSHGNIYRLTGGFFFQF